MGTRGCIGRDGHRPVPTERGDAIAEGENSEIKIREAWHSLYPKSLRLATPPAEQSSVG
jgi:hypothetical protein